MSTQPYRCGNSNAVYNQPTSQDRQGDASSVRLQSTLHFDQHDSRSFRVLTVLRKGETALLCMGKGRESVLALARSLGRELPAGTEYIRLEKWMGTPSTGWWQAQRCGKGELPSPMHRRRRGRRLRGRRNIAGDSTDETRLDSSR